MCAYTVSQRVHRQTRLRTKCTYSPEAHTQSCVCTIQAREHTEASPHPPRPSQGTSAPGWSGGGGGSRPRNGSRLITKAGMRCRLEMPTRMTDGMAGARCRLIQPRARPPRPPSSHCPWLEEGLVVRGETRVSRPMAWHYGETRPTQCPRATVSTRSEKEYPFHCI